MLNNLDESKFFSIGEFVKICGTTRATLYHYEKIGLLTPETNKYNSYRYYKLFDYYLFMYIAHLTRIGFSLIEIREFVLNKTCDCYMQAQQESYARMAEQQAQIQLRNERTQRGLRSLKKSLSQPLNHPQIAYRNEENFLSIPFEGGLNSKNCIQSIAKLRTIEERPDIDIERNFLGFYSEQLVSEDPPTFKYALSKMRQKYPCDYLFTQTEGTYVSMYYPGPFIPEGDQAYKILANYLRNHCFKPLTGVFVEDIVGPFISNDPSEYLALMYVRIE